MKHASLKQIAVIAAILLSSSSLIGLSLISLLNLPLNAIIIGFISLSVFSFSYFLIYFLVDGFVYRRIKILYKNIHALKSGKNTEFKINTVDPISEVENEVSNFSKNKSAEIEQLKNMEQYRREFLGDVSHELKTPIFNTQGYIETLLNGAMNNPSVNVSYLKKASKNLDRLSNIVDNLLTISHNESGNLKLNLSKFDIVKLIHEVFESQEMTADIKDISLEFKKGSPNSKMVFADKPQIETVLNNLVNNAIKYGKQDGKVIVGFYDMDKNVLIEITDDGPGIEQQHLPRLFERFYRIDKHRSRFDGGNGLGLSICKHILEAHEQTIHVRSSIGIGTTFGFTLPKA